MNSSKIKVINIAGFSRSGSTILGNILGQLEGFLHVGELRYIWDYGLAENRLCGCGEPLQECRFWKAVLDKTYSDVNQIDVRELIRLRESGARTRHLPLMLMPGGKQLLKRRLGKYLNNLEKLCHGIQSISKCRVIVDSSKRPVNGYLLGLIPSTELYVVHLVRDPRASAFSWMRKKRRPETGGYMEQYSPWVSSIQWDIQNLAAETFWRRVQGRYLMLRYEDFIESPREAIETILHLVQEEITDLPFVANHRVKISSQHTIWGNPGRLQTGTVELYFDNEWERKMTRSDKGIVTMLTWPLLLKYRYPLRKGF